MILFYIFFFAMWGRSAGPLNMNIYIIGGLGVRDIYLFINILSAAGALNMNIYILGGLGVRDIYNNNNNSFNLFIFRVFNRYSTDYF